MVQCILIVSHHEKDFFAAQRKFVGRSHGKRFSIDFDSRIFTSNEELGEYHDEMKEKYHFIYYTLSVKMKSYLKRSGRIFGVILAPRKNRKSIEFKIVHHVPGQEKEVVVANKNIPRSRGAKSYRNIPVSVRKSA